MYEDYIPLTKRQNERTVTKGILSKGNNSESKLIQKPMLASSSYFASSTPIQMVRFVDHEYGKPPGTYTWEKESMEKINAAINDALTHLRNALAYVRKSKLNLDKIDEAISAVYNVLNDDIKLSIFPLPNDEESFGMAAEGICEISISLKHNRTPFDFSKTLIHEAFHIIGGCWDITDEHGEVLEVVPDDKCNGRTGQDSALNTLLKKDNIRRMSADHFAQFVMKCEKS